MSRIDEALTMWEAERSTAAVDSRSIDSAAAATLNQYPQEQADRYEQQPAESHTDLPEREAAQEKKNVASARTTANAGTSQRRADLHARLVTGAASTVSIEQYRRLAAVLHDVQVEKQLKTLMITSSVPQEGKTLTVLNVALTLSESYGRRVLMIDADLRCPSLHPLLDIPNGRGISEALREPRGELPIVEISKRLSVLTAGRPGPTPLVGLSSTRMGEVIDECAARFDWVLIDTSPVGVLPDASVFARLVGGVIFVIRAGWAPAAAVERAVAEIGSDSIIGTVLNRVEERRIAAAGYYHQYGSASGKR